VHINFRVHDLEVIAHLEQLEATKGRGAKSHFCNEALEAHVGHKPVPPEVLDEMKKLVRQIVGIATNLNQLALLGNQRGALSSSTVSELEQIRDDLKALHWPLRNIVKRWSK
jgi:hypothetical protein